MEFRVLGPLEVSNASEIVHFGGPRERTALALLLLEANHVVPVDRLIDAVWDDEPPATARGQIQICISSLRRRILAVCGEDLIATRSPGYLLKVEPGTLDLHLFEEHVATGRAARAAGDVQTSVAELRSGLALWRGPALSGVASRVIQLGVTRLNERRLVVLGECLDTELRAGAHHDLIGELAELVEQQPLREHFRALLMTALYRGGRQAEALETYRRTREVLMDELGIEPGEELRRLHQQMLANEFPLTEAESEPAEAAAGAQIQLRTPSLLPAAIPDFTGRRDVVELLRSGAGEAGRGEQALRVSVIVGQGGAGKTTLALHVAHLLAPDFPDGQLFARLRDGDRLVSPLDILERFLRALGVSGPAMPEGIEERAELFRDLLGGRRMLIVLDDAMTEQQVAQLLPGNAQCSVIVTSRRRLAGLPSGGRVEIGALSERASSELLARIVGAERIDAEPESVAELCRLCGQLPLALRIVAARLSARPHWSVTDLVDRLADESHRLDEMHYGEMGIRASISLTYDGLSPDARLLFRRLALLESPSFASWVAAPLLQADVLHAQDVLEELAEAYLVDTELGASPGQVRYRLHDITRPFARERLVEENAEDRRSALERWFGAMLGLAGEAHRREYSGDYLHTHSTATRWRLPDWLVDRLLKNPLSWYEQERSSLVAAVAQSAALGLVEYSWGLALSAVTLFESRSYFDDWRETHKVALKAAVRAEDRRGEATMRYSLGSLYMFEQRVRDAREQLEQSEELYTELADRHGIALALRNMAFLDRIEGDLESAAARGESALSMLQAVGDRVAEAHVLHNLAQVRLAYGEQDAAQSLLQRAAHICDQLGNRRVGAQVQHSLGELFLKRGHIDSAAEAYGRVLVSVRESGDQVGECYALLGLAAVDLGRGRLDTSRGILLEAQELAVQCRELLAQNRIALVLAEVELESNDLPAAAEAADRAVRGFSDLGAALYSAGALAMRGQIHAAAGEPQRALEVWQSARKLLSGLKLTGALALSAKLNQGILALRTGGPVAVVAADEPLDLSA